MIGSVILYTKATQINDLQYVDAFFMSFSAMTGTGLSVGTLWTLLILGHAIPIHAVIAFLRALTLRSVLKVNSDRKRRCQATIHKQILHVQEKEGQENDDSAISAKIPSPLKTHITGREIYADLPSPDVPQNARHFIIIANPSDPCQSRHFHLTTGNGHKSPFADMNLSFSWILSRLKTNLQRSSGSIDPEEPGWVEYKALILISGFTMIYTILFLFIGILSIGLWLKLYRPDIPQADGISPVWAGTFLATSALVNNGMSLIDANMAPFQLEPTPLLICGILVLSGNTLFPCILRFVIWAIRKMIPDRPRWRLWRQTFDFVLTQPQSRHKFTPEEA
ncbi:Low-affinity potassium transport protein [Penicillium subrubescens]|uniref:Low-affinity potassium transport protein n=1 Tax=Penicillium subrubescens TaxID=1316194 RepID=A0A1Q5TC21_9EURO|nr:Low-affinity potassium transport protein [Penicillium subrubescens]